MRAVLLFAALLLTSCTRMKEHAVCYVFGWNAVIYCWPDGAALKPPLPPTYDERYP